MIRESVASVNRIRVRRIEAWALRVAISRPVETSFGIMHDRPAVFVRLEADDGSFGFGEIWCNFPACGAEHRARLAVEELGPLLTRNTFASPAEAFDVLTKMVHVRVLQTGETGPFNQVIAGIDMALWDLCARRAGKPLRRYLDDDARDSVPAYASGIHIGIAADVIAEARQQGIRAFKVKVGFDLDADLAALDHLAGSLLPGERLFADANQAWDIEAALKFVRGAAKVGLGWLEEPLAADAPAEDWARLADEGGVPLAAGENITGDDDFAMAIAAGSLAYIQPDMAKWGGFSKCLPIARTIMAGGKTYCPHYLGGGIGLLASAHLLAAVGGDGIMELDTNPNPLRESFIGTGIVGGALVLCDEPGLGINEIPDDFHANITLHRQWAA
ncbi:MAG: mandelate racemase/muconate lactonizing enzyme family protein [Rhodospirillales bacterium]